MRGRKGSSRTVPLPLRFPTGVYKDTVDAGVQGILYLMDKPRANLGEIGDALGKESYWRR